MTMTRQQYAEKMFKKYNIDYESLSTIWNGVDISQGNFRGERNGKIWHLNTAGCACDGYYTLKIGDYTATKILIQTAIKKILEI